MKKSLNILKMAKMRIPTITIGMDGYLHVSPINSFDVLYNSFSAKNPLVVEIRQEAVEADSTKAWTKANSIIVFEATIAEVVVEVEVNEPIFPLKRALEQPQRNLPMTDFNGKTKETCNTWFLVDEWFSFAVNQAPQFWKLTITRLMILAMQWKMSKFPKRAPLPRLSILKVVFA